MNYIKLYWFISNNFGDSLNYYLVKKLSSRNVVLSNLDTKHYICIGSILSNANENSTVWGAGIGYDSQVVSEYANIISVRGNISKSKCKQHINYVGDPAILLPYYYNPIIDIKYDIGIIPHYINYEECLNFNINNKYKIIDPFQNIEDFINDVKSCNFIYSSSLHGLIVADSYNVPNCMIEFNTKLFGDGIKFADYYSTTDVGEKYDNIKHNEIGKSYNHFSIKNYKYDKVDLLNSCPFLNK
jgi:pyruvyltransferase